jgi:hypothetical protein
MDVKAVVFSFVLGWSVLKKRAVLDIDEFVQQGYLR